MLVKDERNPVIWRPIANVSRVLNVLGGIVRPWVTGPHGRRLENGNRRQHQQNRQKLARPASFFPQWGSRYRHLVSRAVSHISSLATRPMLGHYQYQNLAGASQSRHG